MSICSPSLVLKAGERSHAKALFGEAGEEVASRLNLCAIITFLFRQKKHLCTFHCCFLGHCFSLSRMVVPAMATKMKGIYKSFKCISQIFVVKEREMEIGYPTDVKHVAHIGWDGQSGTAPSWMHEFKTAPDFSSSIGNSMDSNALSTWSSQDFEQSMGRQSASDMFKDASPTDVPNIPKKHKRKKKSSTCSPKSSSSRTLRGAKSKATFNEKETANLQV